MKLKYKTELLAVVFISLVGIILSFGFKIFLNFTPVEGAIIDMLIGYIIFSLSLLLVIARCLHNLDEKMGRVLLETPEFSEDLPEMLKELIDKEKEDYLKYKNLLLHKAGRYTVPKKNMYIELTKFAEATSKDSGDEIKAISSIDIEDFQTDPFAQSYLEANTECVKRGVPVKRIFLLSDADLRNKSLINIVITHGEKLAIGGLGEVKWIKKKDLPLDYQDVDLALFNRCIVVRQLGGRNYQITIMDENDLNDAETTFSKIWTNPNCKDYRLLKNVLRGKEI